MRTLICLLFACAPLAAQPAAPPPDRKVLTSEHYRLQHNLPEARAKEAIELLEKAYPQYKAFWGKEPELKDGQKLLVRFFANHGDWWYGMRAAGIAPPQAGGYYSPPHKAVFLYVQPTIYYTRTLLLHEAAHQFHYLTSTRNLNPRASWYTEGIAEYNAWHTWDGTTLKLRQLPLSLQDYPELALRDLDLGKITLAQLLEGKEHRPLGCVLVRYLAETPRHQKAWQQLRALLDARRPGKESFVKLFGQPQAFGRELHAWLRATQQPWAQVWNQWERRGDRHFRGLAAGVYSAAKRKAACRAIQATVEIPAAGTRWGGIGLLLHHADDKHWTMALLRPDGAIEVVGLPFGRWRSLAKVPGPAPRPGQRVRLEARRESEQVAVYRDGQRVGAWRLPGATLGLALHAAQLDFREVTATLVGEK